MLMVIPLYVHAYAVGDKLTINGIVYQISELKSGTAPGKMSVVSCNLTGNVTIPSQVTDPLGDFYTVTTLLKASIGNGVTSLTLSEGMTTLADGSLGSGLTTVNLPASLTTLNGSSFSASNKLTAINVAEGNAAFVSDNGVLFNQSKTTLIKYPTAKTDASYALPATVTTLPNNAFSGVNSLQMLSLGGVQTLANNAIQGCSNLTTINVPASATTIGERFVDLCGKLTDINVAPANPKYESQDGVLFTKGGTVLMHYPVAKQPVNGSYTIPSTVTETSPNAFARNIYLKQAIVPSSVVKLGVSTFINCTNLTDIQLSEGLKEISVNTFSGTGITSITIPSTVSKMDAQAFNMQAKLTEVNIAPGEPAYFKSVDGVLFSASGRTLVYYPPSRMAPQYTDYTIPAHVDSIGNLAFKDSKMTNVQVIPSNVKYIGASAFQSSTQDIAFAEGSQLTRIDKAAFSSMKALVDITLPASVVELGDNVFSSNPNLASFTIADNSKLIKTGAWIWEKNPKLTTFIIGDNCMLDNIREQEFRGDVALTTVKIGANSLGKIGREDFAGCTSLSSVTFAEPSRLTTIESRAFDGCTALTSITLPSSLSKIETSAFNNCTNLASVTFAENSRIKVIGSNAFQNCGLTDIDLPNSIERIEKEAFNMCVKLQTVDIPANVSFVSARAFASCDNLTHINVDSTNQTYSSMGGMLLSKDRTVLNIFPPGMAGDKYTFLPPFITTIDSAFYTCRQLKNVTIPRYVTEVKDYSFSNCPNLSSISFLGETIPAFGPNTFLNTPVKNITVYVRKKWYEQAAANGELTGLQGMFKEVHSSFIASAPALDRGIEYFPTSQSVAGVIAFDEDRTSVVIPASTSQVFNGNSYTYEVATVFNETFKNNRNTKAVVFLGNIEVVGIDAFTDSSNGVPSSVQDIYFAGNTVPKLLANEFDAVDSYPISNNQNVYMKPSMLEQYKAVWGPAGTDRLSSQIPVSTSRHLGTKCFPFDVNYAVDGLIKPYLVLSYEGDLKEGFVASYGISSYSVPANLGVLLRSRDFETATSYCEIDEEQRHIPVSIVGQDATNSLLKGVVEDWPVLNGGNTLYALSGSTGMFRRLMDGLYMPFFKAYLQIPGSAGAKQYSFKFIDDSIVSGIISLDNNVLDEGNYFGLDGIKVVTPTKGVYIHNGKKLIVR